MLRRLLGALGACCCFSGDQGQVYDACPAAHICPGINVTCDMSVLDGCGAILACEEIAGVDCALDALASGSSGALFWRLAFADWFEDTGLHLIGDGTAIITTHHNDFEYNAEAAVVRRAIKPAEFFDECKNLPKAADRFDCLQQALEGDVIETCLPASEAPTMF